MVKKILIIGSFLAGVIISDASYAVSLEERNSDVLSPPLLNTEANAEQRSWKRNRPIRDWQAKSFLKYLNKEELWADLVKMSLDRVGRKSIMTKGHKLSEEEVREFLQSFSDREIEEDDLRNLFSQFPELLNETQSAVEFFLRHLHEVLEQTQPVSQREVLEFMERLGAESTTGDSRRNPKEWVILGYTREQPIEVFLRNGAPRHSLTEWDARIFLEELSSSRMEEYLSEIREEKGEVVEKLIQIAEQVVGMDKEEWRVDPSALHKIRQTKQNLTVEVIPSEKNPYRDLEKQCILLIHQERGVRSAPLFDRFINHLSDKELRLLRMVLLVEGKDIGDFCRYSIEDFQRLRKNLVNVVPGIKGQLRLIFQRVQESSEERSAQISLISEGDSMSVPSLLQERIIYVIAQMNDQPPLESAKVLLGEKSY